MKKLLKIPGFVFAMERVEKDHACGCCRRRLKVGDVRVTISGRMTFARRICRTCSGKVSEFFDEASWTR